MALQDMLKDLRELDLSELSADNIGSWPMAVKVLAWVLALVLVLGLGYYFNISDLRQQLTSVQSREGQLRREFEDKAFKAANLQALRRQMQEMEESFGALVSQLPSDTEVPGLLEDITNRGVDSGLEFQSINLQSERTREFYVELPIQIVVSGGYHDFGSFVSGISGLPRIVTLHNFRIDRSRDGRLNMNIEARTYRYRDV